MRTAFTPCTTIRIKTLQARRSPFLSFPRERYCLAFRLQLITHMRLWIILSLLAVVAFASIANVYAEDKVTTAIIQHQYIVKVEGGINLVAIIAEVEKLLSGVLGSVIELVDILVVGDGFLAFVVITPLIGVLEAALSGLGGKCTIVSDLSLQRTFDNVVNPNKKRSFKRSIQKRVSKSATKVTTQENSIWNLARISERQLNTKQMDYSYYSSGGAGTDLYFVDDGIDIHHTDFGGRAKWGHSVFNNTPNNGAGHSTLVAGVAAGTSVGVAKKANIISVEVFDQYGRGTLSGVISGLGWITKYARHCNCSVINMSFGIPSSYSGVQLLNDAVTSAVNKGFPVFASAGDSAVDACTDVPGSNSKVFTVASTNNTDYPDPNTNFGKCVSMNAPGVNIITDWISTNSAQAMISGSSYAVPHATGVAALFLAVQPFTPLNLYSAMKKYATSGAIHNLPKGTPNLLLYNQL